MLVSTFDVFGHGVHGVPVRIDGDEDGSQVGKRLDFICGKQNRSVKSPASPSSSGFGGFTDLVHHFHHFLQLLGADVRTVGEPEVDEDPLAQEVLAPSGFVVVVDEGERAPQCRPSYRLGPFFFNHWELFGRVIKKCTLSCCTSTTPDLILTFFLFLLEVFHAAEQSPAHRKRYC